MRYNYETYVDHLAHIAVMAYNISLTQQQVKVHSSLCMDVMHIYQLYTICYSQNYAIWLMMSVKYTWMQ